MRQVSALLLALCAVPALAAETVAVAPADLTDIQTLDEVQVTGERNSLSQAQKAVVEAEDRFYARYNDLNKDDRFDIICRVEAPTGAILKRRVCQARFVEDATQGDAAKLTETTAGGSLRLSSTPAKTSPLDAELKRRQLQMVRDDPELLRALLERARLQEHYDQLRKKKFKGRRLVWD